jgi:hypothetical protein
MLDIFLVSTGCLLLNTQYNFNLGANFDINIIITRSLTFEILGMSECQLQGVRSC